MARLRSTWLVAAWLGLLAGCGVESDAPSSVGEQQGALGTSCTADADCASGFVCWTNGNSCVRASSCYSGSTGPGVFVGSLAVDATDTAADLQSLNGAWCVTGDVSVKKTALTDLSGLSGVITVAGNVNIEDNSALVSLEGLNALRRTSKVALFRNASLTSLSALSRLDTLMSLQVYINPQLTSLSGLERVASISWAEVVNNAGLTSLAGLDSVANAYSYIDVRQNPRLTNLSGLGSLTSVGNLVQVMDNPQLQSLQGLGQLATVGNLLRVMRNAELDDLNGLGKLKSARTFQVSDNPQLDSCNVSALALGVAADCSGCVRNGPCLPPDHCPDDPAKLEPGLCGCGVADTDTDSDGVPDCTDTCAGHDDHVDEDRNGIADGCQECVTAATCDDGNPATTESCVDTHCVSTLTDFCPDDPSKLDPGICGCNVPDSDSDFDGIVDCRDACAGFDDRVDEDRNGVPDGCQQCVTAATCEDNDPCTADACVATACEHTPNSGATCGQFGTCSADGACVERHCTIEYLASLAEGDTWAFAVSSDGRTVAVQTSTFNGAQVSRWTAAGGRVFLNAGSTSLIGRAMSADGRSIGGETSYDTTGHGFFESAGVLSYLQGAVAVRGISADGRFSVGFWGNSAYRWEGPFLHPVGVSFGTGSVANDVSPDGSLVVGKARLDNRGLQAFVWQAGVITGLGDLANNATSVASEATAISPNGRIVVGISDDSLRRIQPFRWTRETGMVLITPNMSPRAVTDGGMVLGGDRVLNSSIGTGDLKPLLLQCGVDLGSNWRFSGQDMTPDGKTIVGSVSTLSGQLRNRAAVVKLP